MVTQTKRERIAQALSLSRTASHGQGLAMRTLFEAKEKGRAPLDQWMLNSQFVIRKGIDTAFRREANRQLSKVAWVYEHIVSLSYIILRDILSGYQLTEKDLYKPVDLPSSLSKNRPRLYAAEREVRRLVWKYYPHMFWRVTKPSYRAQKFIDEAEKKGNIVIGPPRPSRPVRDRDDRIRLLASAYTSKHFDEWFFSMDYADPLFVKRLERYWTDLKEILASIRKFELLREEFSWLVAQIASCDYVVAVLLQDTSTEVERRWFGNLNADSRKRMLSHLKLVYTPQEAMTTIRQYKHWLDASAEENNGRAGTDQTSDPLQSHIFEFITDGAVDYARRGDSRVGKWLFDETIRQGVPMNDRDTATCHHNLAVFEFLNEDFGPMVNNLHVSLEHWKASGSELRAGIDYGYMGAAYRELGLTDVGAEAWSRGLAILSSSAANGIERLCAWMEMAQLASKIQDWDWTEECLYSGLETASSVNAIADADSYFLQVLTRLKSPHPSFEDIKGPRTPCAAEPFSQGNLVSLCGPDIHLH